MATFITLTRMGPPTRDVLVNVDRMLLVQQSQAPGGTVILFDSEHTITFADTLEETTRKIQHGPYVMNDHA
jgi:hypothetical protein